VCSTLFAAAGTRLEDHLRLIPQPMLARHWWPDGATLDLHADAQASAEAIGAFAGRRTGRPTFADSTPAPARPLTPSDAPVMRRRAPRAAVLARRGGAPRLWPMLRRA
jgi:1-hydroxycarotenoid 3,4-desaturase